VKLARFGIAVAHAGASFDVTGSVTMMIAPDESVGKRGWNVGAANPRRARHGIAEHHGFVSGIIMLPNCSQARAKLECEQ
jgi:hypothetical protein